MFTLFEKAWVTWRGLLYSGPENKHLQACFMIQSQITAHHKVVLMMWARMLGGCVGYQTAVIIFAQPGKMSIELLLWSGGILHSLYIAVSVCSISRKIRMVSYDAMIWNKERLRIKNARQMSSFETFYSSKMSKFPCPSWNILDICTLVQFEKLKIVVIQCQTTEASLLHICEAPGSQ